LKRYEKLLSMEIFNRNEVVSLYNNAKSADSILYNYIRKGYIASVKRNLYVAISPYSKQPVANRFQIASRIKDDSYITHHTAFDTMDVPIRCSSKYTLPAQGNSSLSLMMAIHIVI